MANFLIGTQIKFPIELTALGFDMDTQDFDIEVKTARQSVKGSKANGGSEDGKLIIYRDPELTDNPSVSDSSSPGDEEPAAATWYGIIDTTGMSQGEATVVATAHIVDSYARDGVRNELAKASLGTLVNP